MMQYCPIVARLPKPNASAHSTIVGGCHSTIAGASSSTEPQIVTITSMVELLSVPVRLLTTHTTTALRQAPASATSSMMSKPEAPGRIITSTPTKPTAVAVQRRQRIVSPRNNAATTITNSGVVKLTAVASARCSRVSTKKPTIIDKVPSTP